MIVFLQIAETGLSKSLRNMRAAPNPNDVQGLRFSQSWLMSPLRRSKLPEIKVTGASSITVWDDDESLDRFLDHRAISLFNGGWQARCNPIRMIGAWPGLEDLPRREVPVDGPVIVVTLARYRWYRALAFLLTAADAEREALEHPAFLEGTSLLRPTTRVSTVTLWRSVKEMREYTVGSEPGGHKHAMQEHSNKPFHFETSFLRLEPYATNGQWNGMNPIPTSADSPSMSSSTSESMLSSSTSESMLSSSTSESMSSSTSEWIDHRP